MICSTDYSKAGCMCPEVSRTCGVLLEVKQDVKWRMHLAKLAFNLFFGYMQEFVPRTLDLWPMCVYTVENALVRLVRFYGCAWRLTSTASITENLYMSSMVSQSTNNKLSLTTATRHCTTDKRTTASMQWTFSYVTRSMPLHAPQYPNTFELNTSVNPNHKGRRGRASQCLISR